MRNCAARSIAGLTARLLACWPLGFGAVAGDLQGEFIANAALLDSYRLRLGANPDGSLHATLDLPRYGYLGLVCSDITVEGDRLSFKVPGINSSWTGTIQENGTVLEGEMSAAGTIPMTNWVTFRRDAFVPAREPSAVDGYWLAFVENVGQSLRTQITVRSDAAGREYCTYDNLDRSLFAAECGRVVYVGRNFSFDVPELSAHWTGKLSSDGNELLGIWVVAGQQRPMNFQRRSAPEPPPVGRR